MFSSTSDLAEDKLLLLYLLEELKLPISKNQITQIILENNFINYFALQQYLSELINSNLIDEIDQKGKHKIVLSSKGSKVLSLFKNRISEDKMNAIDNYLIKQLKNTNNDVTVTSNYSLDGSNYIVNLKSVDKGSVLIELKLNVPLESQAKALCSRWNENYTDIYEKLIKILIDD